MNEHKKQIMVEKHKWPDEIRNEKRKRRNSIFIVAGLVFAFGLGYLVPKPTTANNPINAGVNAKDSEKFDKIQTILDNEWYFGKDIENLDTYVIDNAIKGMSNTNELDTHTQYLDSTAADSLKNQLSGSLVGIGIQYTPVGDYIMIEKVFMDTPAQKGGLQIGDIIKKVDGVDLAKKELSDIRSMVIGEENTTVKIEVVRGKETLDFSLVRKEISMTVYGYVEDNVGVLEISSFSENSASEVQTYLDDFRTKKISKIIIDLRGNGGGYVKTAQAIAGLFMPEGNVVAYQKDKDGNETSYTSTKASELYRFDKMVVLIDENTASASEMLTGALKAYNQAQVVGVNSYGKGTVQSSISFSDGSIFKYTIAEWTRPNHEVVDKVGIKPDIEVKNPEVLTYAPTQKDEGTYRYNEVSTLVKDAQVYLKFLGYDVDRSDGYFSQKSVDAIKKYQKEMGLSEDGNINQALVDALVSSASRKWHDENKTLDKQMLKALEVARE